MRVLGIILILSIFTVLIAPVGGVEYVIGNNKNSVVKGHPNATYVSSEKCSGCHPDIYAEWKSSGHPYKLMTPEEAKEIRPDIPLPEGYVWDDILYVIGGWGWKSRFIGHDGFVITRTKDGEPIAENQYNWEDGSWSAYHSGEDKKYDCTKCHNTGSTYDRDHMDLPGMVGDWEERGVGCEACHGPGSEHIAQGGGKEIAIEKDVSSALCGECHIRGTGSSPPVSGGFIRHHEQYQEIQGSKMVNLNCVVCHDPHKGVHKGVTNPKEGNGIKVQCEACHNEIAMDYKGSTMEEDGVVCIDCHMPKTTKSAISTAKYVGDIRSHIFKINMDCEAKFSYEVDGSEFATGHLTIEYVCLTCHEDKDKLWCEEYAPNTHTIGKEEPVVATTPPPETPVPTPTEEKGICGPTLLVLLALLPVGLYGSRRRKD